MKLKIQLRQTEDGTWRAGCAHMPGCFGHGADPDTAVSRFLEHAPGYLASVSDFVPERLEAVIA